MSQAALGLASGFDVFAMGWRGESCCSGFRVVFNQQMAGGEWIARVSSMFNPGSAR